MADKKFDLRNAPKEVKDTVLAASAQNKKVSRSFLLRLLGGKPKDEKEAKYYAQIMDAAEEWVDLSI